MLINCEQCTESLVKIGYFINLKKFSLFVLTAQMAQNCKFI